MSILKRVGQKLGTFGKNLTGETVRETQKAVNLHGNLRGARESAQEFHNKIMDSDAFSTKFKLREINNHGHKTEGFLHAEDIVRNHIPNKLQGHLDKAIKDRNTARAITAAGVTGTVGGAYAMNKKANDISSNKYLEKIAGMPRLGGVGKAMAIGAGLGAVTGATSAGEGNRVKGILTGATMGAAAGGVAGSVFGRALSRKGPAMAPNPKLIANNPTEVMGARRFNPDASSKNLAKRTATGNVVNVDFKHV